MNDREPTKAASPEVVTFDDAVRSVVRGLEDTLAEFEQLVREVPEEAYTDGEWRVIENAARDIEAVVEQVHLDYEMAAYESEAWYEIVKDLPKVTRLLGDAMLLIREAQARHARQPGGS
jgi:hypothetical protein